MIGQLWNNQFARFVVVGGINTLFGYGLFSVLVLLSLTAGVALFVATAFGVLFNYLTTGRIVFGTNRLGRLPWFVSVYCLTFLINLWCLNELISVGLSPFFGQALLLPIIVVTNFILNRFLVFRVAR